MHLFLEEPVEWIFGDDWGPIFWVTFVHEAVPSFIQACYLALALYWLLRDREADLDATRRRARVFLLLVYGVQVVVSLLVERVVMAYEVVPYEWQYPVHVVLVCIGAGFSTVMVFALMSPSTLALLAPVPKPAEKPPSETDDSDIDVERIRHALEGEHIYRRNGLTVADFAAHLGLPEYRLRALIHNHMNYRNFNALLHRYRVDEVAAALADPKQRQTPILTLALSAGYLSVNPFNRAFRDLKGTTPSEYRKSALREHHDSLKSTPDSASDQA